MALAIIEPESITIYTDLTLNWIQLSWNLICFLITKNTINGNSMISALDIGHSKTQKAVGKIFLAGAR